MNDKRDMKGWIPINVKISPEADKLLRARPYYKGDRSWIIDNLIKKEFEPKQVCSVDPSVGQATA